MRCLCIRWAVESSVLLQSSLYADPPRLDFAAAESARGGEALELLLRVGAPSDHPQSPPCHEGVYGVEPHRIHLFANRRIVGIFPHVLADALSSAPPNPRLLVHRLSRLT